MPSLTSRPLRFPCSSYSELAMSMTPTQILSAEQIKEVHRNTSRILKEIGVKVPNPEVLACFDRNGAEVDFSHEMVRLPEELVQRCLELQIANNARNAPKDRREADRAPLSGTMATQPFIFDHKNGLRRQGSLSDLLGAIVLGNHLSAVRRVSCLVVPGEYPYQASDALSFYLLYTYATKPVFSWMYSLQSAGCIMEMAAAAARDTAHFQSGSLLEYNVETISPLRFAPHSLQIMLECARKGVPMSCGPMLVMGSSAPMSHLATMTLENAEILATLAAIIVLNPENPRFDYVAPAHSMNMANGLCSFGSPNQAIFALMARQIADSYGFDRVVVNCGLSDALYPDYQCGIERGVTLAFASAAGVDEVGLMGIVGADQAASFEQLAIDDGFLCREGHRSFEGVRGRIREILGAHYPPAPAITEGKQAELESILKRHFGAQLVQRFLADLKRSVERDGKEQVSWT
jgi:trimethylamine---corrinoid protein Co-methyltransferase